MDKLIFVSLKGKPLLKHCKKENILEKLDSLVESQEMLLQKL